MANLNGGGDILLYDAILPLDTLAKRVLTALLIFGTAPNRM